MYNGIGWEDSPSTKTPINATNLNKMDSAIMQNATDIEELQEAVIMAENLTVAVADFTTYTASGSLETAIKEDYPYKADIEVGGVTTRYKADVIPSYAAKQLGILCDMNQTRAGYVRIYASEVPEAAITIMSIMCVKAC